SANGPSVTSRFPLRTRTQVAVDTGSSGAATRYWPLASISWHSWTASSIACLVGRFLAHDFRFSACATDCICNYMSCQLLRPVENGGVGRPNVVTLGE